MHLMAPAHVETTKIVNVCTSSSYVDTKSKSNYIICLHICIIIIAIRHHPPTPNPIYTSLNTTFLSQQFKSKHYEYLTVSSLFDLPYLLSQTIFSRCRNRRSHRHLRRQCKNGTQILHPSGFPRPRRRTHHGPASQRELSSRRSPGGPRSIQRHVSDIFSGDR